LLKLKAPMNQDDLEELRLAEIVPWVNNTLTLFQPHAINWTVLFLK